MARYDKVVPKNGVFRAFLAAPFDPNLIEKPIGIGLDANGRIVKGVGQTGILACLVVTKEYRAGMRGNRVDPMTHGEIVDFAPTAGTPGVDFGLPGRVYYSNSSGDIVLPTNEVQTITVTTGSSPVTLSWNGQGPASVASGANGSTLTAAQVLAALESLSNIAPGDVAVTGSAGGPFTVTFTGALAGTDVPAITATNATISTGTAGGALTGLVRIGHTVEGQRLVVRVEP